MRRRLDEIFAAPGQPKRSRWDIVLVAFIALGSFQPDNVMAASATLLPVAVVVWFRHRAPFVAVVATMALTLVAFDTVGADLNAAGIGLAVTIYGLARWGSQREALAGLIGIVLLGNILSPVDAAVGGDSTVGRSIGVPIEMVVESLIWIVPFILGLTLRNRAVFHASEVTVARASERAAFARELHDTVAHHVSAITIWAQAGQAVGEHRPEAAIEALRDIEDEATKTLDEMRQMVRALRDPGDEGETAPQAGIRQIQGLANPTAVPAVSVDVLGAVDDLAPSVESSLFRIAQESTTNARRHAKDASEIRITVSAQDDEVRLTVADDGRRAMAKERSTGFGLIGMAERAALLGGSFQAAPGETRGWVVEATLPRVGAPRATV